MRFFASAQNVAWKLDLELGALARALTRSWRRGDRRDAERASSPMGASASVDTAAPETTRDEETALMSGLESGISQAINTAVAAHPEWKQAAPGVSEVLQSIAKEMSGTAEKTQAEKAAAKAVVKEAVAALVAAANARGAELRAAAAAGSRPTVVVLTGGPGVGKTTLIDHLHKMHGWPIVPEAAIQAILDR